MKGAKGGNRDRIISWLFSEKTRKKREEELELEQKEAEKIDEKHKERRKGLNNKDKDNIVETVEEISKPITQNIPITSNINDNQSIELSEDRNIKDKEDLDQTIMTTDDKAIESFEDKDKAKDVKNNDNEVLISDYPIGPKEELKDIDIDIEIDKDKNKTTTITTEVKEVEIFEDKSQNKPVDQIETTVTESPVDEIESKDKDKHTTVVEEAEISNEEIKDIPESEILDIKDHTSFFPDVEVKDDGYIEKPELIKISILEEIDELFRNDYYDLNDIRYRIEVLNQLEKDEVLLENVEKIQKELEELIKKFNEIKKKYETNYTHIRPKDLDFINALGVEGLLTDYIGNSKDGLDSSNTINMINEINEFIVIINNIIEIEKQKDIVSENVENKIEDFNIRDEEFIKLQDQYANVEGINARIAKYNADVNSIIANINEKVANSVDIRKRIETTVSIVPDLNKIMGATVALASSSMIPPTPLGNLFKASLFISAAHMMATAFTPKVEEKEVTDITVTDYSREILVNKDNIKNALNNIDNAFLEIKYMKDMFDKEFSQYSSQIPEYDKLIQNIFSIEKELTRQQAIAYDYSNSFDQVLDKNNQKVKILENE